jgi:hypothetical protein
VTVRNTGHTTWTRAGGYKLGGVDDEDPLRDTRVWLDEGDVVAPGVRFRFDLTLSAPADPGRRVSDWRMVRELVRWFGESAAAEVDVVCDDPGPVDPTPGEPLPLPDMSAVVRAVHEEDPGRIRRSCLEEGGDWSFMDAVVDRLRAHDVRWGYNGKRGDVNNPSQDVVDYHHGPGPSEGSTDVYIIDVIVGHCGPDPQPGWLDQTQATRDGGTIGRWTGRGRF